MHKPTKELFESVDINKNRSFNKFTSHNYDKEEVENRDRIDAKPLKYYVSQILNPDVKGSDEYTEVGYKKVFNTKLSSIPEFTRLNELPKVYEYRQLTTPNLSSPSETPNIMDISSKMRTSGGIKERKSGLDIGSKVYNRWDNNDGIIVGGYYQPDSRSFDRGDTKPFEYKTSDILVRGGIDSRIAAHNAI